ncbi:hypothetical protein O7623_02030 [Solwaraspora sp. WMMD791]|uniref:hypothetical protein n=1 Tax=Solwaraspora sp. WMMD791 TaxID=3016086 RepID=UPI00249B978E|nr:hypothetical protein [Solwaraspora sp. WMMD791]WFE28009.1 hypothetical protein O7623_02030 [Solwaraspora sp. WMMD791]
MSESQVVPQPQVKLDPASLPAPTRHLHDPLEKQLTSAVRLASERVRERYAGEPEQQVCRSLLEETRAALHPDIAASFQPDMAQFCRLAAAIVQGQPT